MIPDKKPALPWWGRISSRAAGHLSIEADLSLDTRLLFLAIGNANTAGHAYFPEGVERCLSRVDRATGELLPYGERHMRTVIRKLIDAGALSIHSTRRCLVVTDGLWSTGAAKPPRQACPEHGHQKRWTAWGWSDADDEARLRNGVLSAV
ncbi:hypothetical protein JOD57_002034 [Geodermatophilus bullaregiensis]|uniref:hypothetical protein n=1 Tax=Geodermatophilus bullaregiensis TaxID=1564160 RepID=UPI001958DB39|nr:hypothetical protein [Geodermatophilus bullaregiensis]MBM7806197.1 hypothetical protein [Geodermatophilus bullaregiensis]